MSGLNFAMWGTSKRLGDRMIRYRNRGTRNEKNTASMLCYARAMFSIAALTLFTVPLSASAQSKTQPPANVTTPSEALSLNMPKASQIDLNTATPSSLSGTLLDVPLESVGSGLFNFNTSNRACLTGSASCLTRDDRINFSGSHSQYLKLNDNGLSIELSPRASLRFDDDSSSALVGALVKIGDDLRETKDFNTNTWYFFAGADAEALTYKPGSTSSLTRGFNLQDRVIVGDAQAGLGYKIGDADLSLAYIRREVSSFSSNDPNDDVSYTEDAAALSFTWRR